MTPNLQLAGHRVLVLPDEVEDEYEIEGTELKLHIVQDERLARAAQMAGTIVSVGPSAWKAFREVDDKGREVNGRPWAKVGDRILFSKYSGRMWEDPQTEIRYLFINDEDVLAVIPEEKK